MRKGFLAAALIPVTILVSAAGARAATSTTTGATVIVSPGSRVCTTPIYGASSVRAQGQAKPGVEFTLHQSSNQSTYQTISQTPSDQIVAWAAQFSTSTGFFQYFPGWFKACATNDNAKGATVTLNVTTDN
jgi:hypothetical protein